MKSKGRLFIISGPSGAGKSTVLFKAIEGKEKVCFSISATTRKARPTELNGREYFFISRESFEEMIKNDELLEYAQYVSNYYGTPREFVEKKLAMGWDVILDIEIQGARQVSEKMPEAVKIFIVPPSIAELERRLIGRGTDAAQAISSRLERARQEYLEADFYDYLIVNEDAESASKELSSIMTAEKCRFADRADVLKLS